jgi:undecaprenyl-diphosphatase
MDQGVTYLQAVILGALQGLGEFLPISSSGHLIVVPWLMGWSGHGLAFDVALHLGTLVAVVYAFASDWARMGASALRGLRSGRPFAESGGRMLGLLAMASIPGAVVGLLIDDWAEAELRSPLLVASSMAVMGLVLLAADRKRGDRLADGIALSHAMMIGMAQALALVPGVSRSGVTISAALFLGYRREEAARFSFLLATPITFGAAVLKVPHLLVGNAVGVVLIGIVVAAIVGWLSIFCLLRYVRVRDYRPFVWYRLAFAALVVVALAWR